MTSRWNGVFMMLKSVVAVCHMAKPEWCLVVKTTYLTPASFASAAQSCGLNLRGLKVFGRSSKKRLSVVVGGADQRVADHHAELAVDAPVDEQAEAQVAEPLQAVGPVAVLAPSDRDKQDD